MRNKSLDDTIQLGINRNLIEKTDATIKYIIQNKEYNLDKEELVRAANYIELVENYNYSPALIDFEIQVPRRRPSDYADIVVFQEEDKLSNYIVIENKKQNCTDGEFNQAIEQGFGNANSLRSKYLIVDNFSNRIVYDVDNYPPNEREANKIGDIPINYGLILILPRLYGQ